MNRTISSAAKWLRNASVWMFVVVVVSSRAFAVQITYKEETPDPITTLNYTGAEDTFLIEAFNDPRNQNFGVRSNMSIGNGGASTLGRNHILLRFDVTSLAGQYASIDSARVRLYFFANVGIPAGSFSAYRVSAANGDWVEGPGASSVASNQFPGSSTWAEKHRGTQGSNGTPNGTPWASGPHVWPTNGGLSIAPADHAVAPIATAAYTGAELANSSIDLVLNDLSAVAAWTAGTNSGLVIIPGNPAQVGGLTFHSSEADTANVLFAPYHPELIIDYTPIPEPSALLLAAVGSVLLAAGGTYRRLGSRRSAV